MKNLSTLFFACFFLVFMSCSKEEIISTDKDQNSDSIIINTDAEEVEGAISTISESTGEGYQLNNNNPTVAALQSTIDFLASNPQVSMFHEAVVKTGMDAAISGDGPYTVFAPNNVAFQNFLANNNWDTMDDISTGTLTTIVKFHLSNSEVNIKDLDIDTAVPIMFNNYSLFVHTTSSPAYLTLGLSQANVLMTDIEQSNGNVNIIDSVLSL